MDTGTIIAITWVIPVITWFNRGFTPLAKWGTSYIAILATGGILLWM